MVPTYGMAISIDKFRFSEMFNSTSGKTSITRFSGFAMLMVGLIMELNLVLASYIKVSMFYDATHSFGVLTLATALLGINRVAADKPLPPAEQRVPLMEQTQTPA